MNILLRIAAVLGGFLAGVVVVILIEGVSSLVYPMPKDLDPNDVEALSKWIGTLPIGAFIFVLTAWAGGCFIGTYVARRMSPGRSAIAGLSVWVLFSLATIANLFMIPHPLWFTFASVVVCLVFGLLGLMAAAPKSFVVQTCRTIDAPIDVVFKTLATVDEFSKAVPGITKVEFLTDRHYGVGTRFRETRRMNGKDATTDLEVTELVENEHLRIMSDAGGSTWDTVFKVRSKGNLVEMSMRMEAHPHQSLARLVSPMILGMVSKFVSQDMDAVKDFCEQKSAS